MSRKDIRWKKAFLDFLKSLRIDSKEVAAVDEFGSPLDMWGSQRMFLDELCEGLDLGQRIFMCLKARQLGITTISLALDIFWMLIWPGTLGALVTDTDTNRDAFRATLDRYITNLPDDMVGDDFRLVQTNKNFLLFPNGSRLDFLVAGTKTKATWGESRGYSLAHLTEVANYGNPKGIASFRETLAENHPHRLFIYESTAKGMNHWKAMCAEAQRDTDSKRFIFIGWWAKELNRIKKTDRRFATYGADEPDREEQELIDEVARRHGVHVDREQLAWYRWRQSDASVSEQDRDQNLPWLAEQAFVVTGHSFFQTRLVAQDLEAVDHETNPDMAEHYAFRGYRYLVGNDFLSIKMQEIVEQARINEVELRVWEEPNPKGQYAIGCDPAYGRSDDADNSAIEVVRCYADRIVQVAEFATAKFEPHQVAWVLAHLAGVYRNCIVNLELTGGAGIMIMREWENVRNRLNTDLYRKEANELGWEDALSQARWYLWNRPDSLGAGYAYNFKTGHDSKVDMLNRLRASYTTRLWWIKSRTLLEEMQDVVQDGSSIGAPPGGYDDKVFASGLANYAWDQWIRPVMITQQLTYENVTREEQGEMSVADKVVERLVANYFRRAEEQGHDPDAGKPRLLVARGLA